jgi:hypothetical protein
VVSMKKGGREGDREEDRDRWERIIHNGGGQ